MSAIAYVRKPGRFIFICNCISKDLGSFPHWSVHRNLFHKYSLVAMHIRLYKKMTLQGFRTYLVCSRFCYKTVQNEQCSMCDNNFVKLGSSSVLFYCPGKVFVRVLTQDSVLPHGVIAFVRTHFHAGWRLPAPPCTMMAVELSQILCQSNSLCVYHFLISRSWKPF